MNVKILLDNTTPLSLAESWESTCTVLVDKPISAAYWKLGEITGERSLNELALLHVEPGKILSGLN
jgi:hypothetical protein